MNAQNWKNWLIFSFEGQLFSVIGIDLWGTFLKPTCVTVSYPNCEKTPNSVQMWNRSPSM